jgi:hypothetical protein
VTLARRLTAAFVAFVALVAAGLVAWRVLKPAEVLATASGGFPVAQVLAPGVTGKTAGAPLIVDERIRVFAAKRQVRADGPVSAKTSYTPRWSFRRWPQQLTGVVAIGTTVVSRWSDGELVALDARSGAIVWRAAGPAAGAYSGLRTGASTVWAPPGLFTAGSRVLVAGAGQVVAFAAGIRLWSAPACADGFTTAGGQYVCPAGAYDVSSGAAVRSWPSGPFTALGCGVAHSGCEGFRDGAGRGWLTTSALPQRTPALDAPDTTVAAGVPLTVTGPTVASAHWRWTDPAAGAVQVLGWAGHKVYLLTADRHLVIVDAATGAATSFVLAVGTEATKWTPGLSQTTASYVAIERLDNPDPNSVDHYFTVETVVIAAT